VSLPLVGAIAALLFFGNKRKKKETAILTPPTRSAQKTAEIAFDEEFGRSGNEDVAAEKAILAYQQAGGKDPIFIAQIQYWTGSR